MDNFYKCGKHFLKDGKYLLLYCCEALKGGNSMWDVVALRTYKEEGNEKDQTTRDSRHRLESFLIMFCGITRYGYYIFSSFQRGTVCTIYRVVFRSMELTGLDKELFNLKHL